jgi:hypothetical protein
MTLSLPHSISNGTMPDADEVQANFNTLLNQANRTFAIGQASAVNPTARTALGTTTAEVSGSAETITVAASSLLLISYRSIALHSWTFSKTTSILGKIQVKVAGSAVGTGAQFEHYVAGAGDGGSARVPVAGSELLGLSAGTYDIALEYTQTISDGGGWCSIQMRGGEWSALVIPV